jgi:drug/metabolite transporter (DMT)-like permease
MSIKSIFSSWDIWVALGAAGLAWFVLPSFVSNDLVINLYNVGISVLAIVFSVFFAALAIIISSGDNDFIQFLEETGDYSTIISSFRSALVLLFFALLYSLLIYASTAIWIAGKLTEQNSLWFVLFVFLFIYGLTSTALSSFDAIRYASFRVRFLQALHIKKMRNEKDNDMGESGNPRRRSNR